MGKNYYDNGSDTLAEKYLKEAAKNTVDMLLKVIKEEETEMKILIGYDLKTRKSVVDLNNYNRK